MPFRGGPVWPSFSFCSEDFHTMRLSNSLHHSKRLLMTLMALSAFGLLLLPSQAQAPTQAPGPVDPAVTAIWRNPDVPTDKRVAALMSQLTPSEKASLMYWLAPAIDRLGIPAYDHGNECLHGLVRPGQFTVFPESINLAATFDPALVHAMASDISDEARAKWNETHGKQLGWASDVLTLWSPVVNMARDPRWGRTQETYGEDPGSQAASAWPL